MRKYYILYFILFFLSLGATAKAQVVFDAQFNLRYKIPDVSGNVCHALPKSIRNDEVCDSMGMSGAENFKNLSPKIRIISSTFIDREKGRISISVTIRPHKPGYVKTISEKGASDLVDGLVKFSQIGFVTPVSLTGKGRFSRGMLNNVPYVATILRADIDANSPLYDVSRQVHYVLYCKLGFVDILVTGNKEFEKELIEIVLNLANSVLVEPIKL